MAVSTYCPLSREQQRMWLLVQMYGPTPALHERGAVWIDGELDVIRLQRAVEAVVRRHEVLRTHFEERDGAPLQRIAAHIQTPWRLIDVATAEDGADPSDREQSLLHAATAEVSRPFDWDAGPLWRVSLLRCRPERHLLVLTMHHILSDGDHSHALFFAEVHAHYHEDAVPPVSLQYREYVESQRAGDPERGPQLDYWREELREAPPLLDLCVDHPRSSTPSFRGATAGLRLAPGVLAGARALAEREGVDLYSLVLASLLLLLHRHSGQEDVLVGIPLDGRPRAELQSILGYFGGPVVIRGRFADDPPFPALARQVHAAVAGARAHGDISFLHLVEALSPPRDPARTPLFQVLFDLRGAPPPALLGAQLRFTAVDIPLPSVAYELIVGAAVDGEHLDLAIDYNADLFAAASIERLLGHWRVLLDGLLADPRRPASALPLLGAHERQQVLVAWNATATPLPADACVHTLFAAQARRTPHAIAAVCEGRTLTYEALDRQANRLARRLIALGVGPDARVAICVPRSLALPVALLAILKTGAAFVPIEPKYPEARIAMVLEDARVTAIVSHEDTAARLPELAVPCLRLTAAALDADDSEDPDLAPAPQRPAYVIFTSGSSGRPKGVVVTHRSLVNHNLDMIGRLGLGPGDRVLQFAALGFDTALEEIFPTLLAGATLVLEPNSAELSFSELLLLLAREQITVFDPPTAYFHEWVLELAATRAPLPASLRQVLFGGEEALPERIARFRELAGPRVAVLNGYGPTETTIIATTYMVDPAEDLRARVRTPIGRPMANVRAYVLDAALQPAPIGVPGELYIGGEGVALGYLHRPDLTAERFVADPFVDDPAARMYRTGDRARWLGDGNLEFLGRADQQVKLRGFRVELHEVETALRELPGVRDVVTAVEPDPQGRARLLAWVVPEPAALQAAQEQAALANDQVAAWRAVYDEAHFSRAADTDPLFNTAGWNSSFDQRPISEAAMRQWRERTLERIRVLAPRRVWEIGCGSGLLLLPLAPACESYLGTDFSANTIADLQASVDALGLTNVRLAVRDADDPREPPRGEVDLVILNSVVQYFPDAAYLRRVLAIAAAALRPGGAIFLGDIRDHGLFGPFHAAVQQARGGTFIDLRARVHEAMRAEEELLVAPEFFTALCGSLPGVRRVEVLLKRGLGDDEMLRYRHDVVLHTDAAAPVTARTVSWSGLDALERQVAATDGPLMIREIPNARVLADVRLWERLERGDERDAAPPEAVEPEALWSLAQRLGRRVRVRRAPQHPGHVDALFEPATAPTSDWPWTAEAGETSNHPLRGAQERALVQQLRAGLKRRLPEYAIPSRFMICDLLPLTAHGKVDRAALPRPDETGVVASGRHIAPRPGIESQIAAMWSDVLHLPRVGACDNFFDLGGHSLYAVQLFSRIRGAFGVEVTFQRFFHDPTVAGMARLLGEHAPARAADDAIAAVSRAEPLPLSFAQERLWFLDQLAPGSRAYNCSYFFRLRGALDVPALRGALDALCARHEPLRTTFDARDGRPFQRIAARGDLALELFDISSVAEPGRPAALTRRLREEARQTFDLAHGPLARAGLIRLGDHEHVLTLHFHHLVVDGWSIDVAFRELGLLYEAARRGEVAALPGLPLQYADFAVWQRRHLGEAPRQQHLEWWLQNLAGAAPLLELPADRPRPAVQTFEGDTESFRLGPELTAALRQIATREGTTLTTALLAVFAAVLQRHSGRDDLLFGVPSANRDRVELEGMLGFFVNTLPLRIDAGGDPSFEALLRRARQATLDAYERASIPFERIVQELRLPRSASHNPLVQIGFVPLPPAEVRLRLAGLASEYIEPESRKTVLDLSLYFWDADGEACGLFEYSTDLFDAATIRRLVGHLQVLATAAAADPGRPIAALPLLTEPEQRTIAALAGTAIAPPPGTLDELFARQVELAGDAAALDHDGEVWSYRELDRRVERLAHALRARGVVAETLVGCCLERSREWVVTVLAIWRAGGVYVPLDPKYPQRRLELLLEDAAPLLVVTHSQLAARLSGCAAALLRLDTDPLGDPPSRLASAARSDSAAYVIFTSGSTGRPKGVVIEHRQARSLAHALADLPEVTAGARVLSFSALGFDASIWELLMALAHGGALCLAAPGTPLFGPDLLEVLARQRISAVTLPPSVLVQLPARPLPDLRLLVAAGEACPAELVARWAAPGRRFLNAYGPTEAAVCATWHVCEPGGAAPPIGRPIRGVTVHVLDAARRPTPIGVPGELYIGGHGVARGYLRRPELSAERFVQDPADPSARLYRTGDRARWLADGALQFLGRDDHQVKLRGFRIELAEVEAALREHPLVRDAVAVVGASERLIAYVATGPELALPEGSLAALRSEQVASWRALYSDDRLYAAGAAGFNLAGWNSSYTQRPIPEPEMREWRDRTVERLLALRPARVWEIGCGSGLLLLPIAPRCAAYLGTDFSPAALARLAEVVAEQRLTQVRLEQREAADFTGVGEREVDTLVLNSVVQYFPDLAYLEGVLRQAARAVAPGGVIFVGDVRDLDLLETFHASVQRFQAGSLADPELAARVRRALDEEPELTVAPTFFRDLCARVPGLAHAEVWHKRGRGDNELLRFRYDVVLYVGEAPPPIEISARVAMSELGSLDALAERLTMHAHGALEVTAIPDARTFADAHPHERGVNAIDPEALWELGERLGYGVRVRGDATRGPGFIAALFERDATTARPRPWPASAAPVDRPLANTPLRARQERALAPLLRGFLQQRLPEHMVPAHIVGLAALPLTPHGKLDRAALPDPERARRDVAHGYVAPRDELERALAAIWQRLLDVEPIGIDDPFFDLGGHSLLLTQMRAEIAVRLARQVAVVELLQRPTIRALAEHLTEPAAPAPAPTQRPRAASDDAVAIIGWAGRFPGAESVAALWDNVRAGVDGVTIFDREALVAAGADPALVRAPEFVPAAGVLTDADCFDAALFGYSPRDALLMDPQQRVFLEDAWAALEDAGYPPNACRARVGVFGGSEAPRYWLERIGLASGYAGTSAYQASLGNIADSLATRVAFKLGLRGPAFTVACACSTSLVAVHLACRSLLADECDLALAGGVAIHSLYEQGHVHQPGGLFASDGRCRPFDARAEGTVEGSAVALVVLKRLSAALADGDAVHAVIRGSAINNDGPAKSSYTAPGLDGQIEVLAAAHAAAGVVPDELGFIEAHGTATQLGDATEVAALTRVFRRSTARTGFCALGSLKSNVGHLSAAAGVSGLIKAALALEHGELPPTLHFERPNPALDLPSSPFFVSAEPRAWPRGATPRRAGVSAFGVGGTNVHVILEEPPPAPKPAPGRAAELLVVSARTPASLATACERLAAHLRAHPQLPLADVAYTLQTGRAALPCRHAVVGRNAAELAARLDAAATSAGPGPRTEGPTKVVFLFPGGGSQRVGMGRALYLGEPVYRAHLDRCAELFRGELGLDLRELLFAPPDAEAAAGAALQRPSLNTAAVFSSEYALAQLLMSWGIRPAAAAGHSLGEYTAACLAGVLTLEDTVALVALRARLHDGLPGAMLIVHLPERELVARLGPGLSLAAVNAPALCVVSGHREAIAGLAAALARDEVRTRLLAVAGASHSELVEPQMPALTARAAQARREPPRFPVISNLSGTWLRDDEAVDPAYWARHMRGTVRFTTSLATLLADPDHVIVEVGPGGSLTSLARMHPDARPGRTIVSAMPSAGATIDDLDALLEATGRLFCAEVPVDWEALHGDRRRHRVPLPTYAFERTPYMLPAAGHASTRTLELPAPRPVTTTATTDPVTAIWRDLLGVACDRSADFFALGGDSFLAMHLRRRVAEATGVTLPVQFLLEHRTLGSMLDHLQARLSPPTSELPTPPQPAAPGLLVRLRPGAAGSRNLFLIQPAGGSVFTYRALAERLADRWTVLGLRASGLEPDEPVLTDIEAIAARHVAEIRDVQPHGPYHLGGHSAGGVIAFEVAQQLLAAGETVDALLLLDAPALDAVRELKLDDVDDLLAGFAAFRDGSAAARALLAALADDERLRSVVLATSRAVLGYRARPIAAPLLFLRARICADPDARPLEQYWLARCEGSCALWVVPGDHFTMLEHPGVETLARIVDATLTMTTATADLPHAPGPKQAGEQRSHDGVLRPGSR